MIESKVRSIDYVQKIPGISESFEVISRKGQGTFASVYTVKYRGTEGLESSVYALKMLIPTVDVRRIENEVRILRRLGGRHNVIRLHTAWRSRDHVFILMPYINFTPFTDYYLSADEAEIARYLRTLLSALAYIHQYRIIHRDVKPTNFLVEPVNKRFYLVDFGLAHSETFGDIDSRWEAQCDTYDKTKTEKSRMSGAHQLKRTLPQELVKDGSQYPAKSARVETRVPRFPDSAVRPDMFHFILPEQPPFSSGSASSTQSTGAAKSLKSTSTAQTTNNSGCVCSFRLAVCRGCRQLPRAPAARRGGTLGFRPPEVMMRCVEQSTAVDMWAVGVIFLSFLTGRYPFIKADDDLDVLHAFTHLLSYERMQAGAKSLNRRLLIDPKPPPGVGSGETPVSWLKTRCVAVRHHEKKFAGLPPLLSEMAQQPTASGGGGETTAAEQKTISEGQNKIVLPASHIFPATAYDLLSRLLEPVPQKRITAQAALRHAFITGSTASRGASSKQQRPTPTLSSAKINNRSHTVENTTE